MKLLSKLRHAINQAFKTKDQKRREQLLQDYKNGNILKVNGEINKNE